MKTHTPCNSDAIEKHGALNLEFTHDHAVQFRFLVFSLPIHFWIYSLKIFKNVRFNNHYDLTDGFLFINQLCLTTVETCGEILFSTEIIFDRRDFIPLGLDVDWNFR